MEYGEQIEDERDERAEDTTEKLARARKLFEHAVDHASEAHAEAHRANRFYHNSEGTGQWEEEDLAYLQDQMRPAFSFNIVKPKVDTMLGMYADAQRTPIVAGTGAEDQLLAEVIDAVKDEILEDAGYERLSSRVFKTGTITGEAALHIEVEPSRKGRGWIQVNLYRILPFELHWDPGSLEPDRCDARYVFWDRWLAKDEFKDAYPDKADLWDSIKRSGRDPYDSQDRGAWSEPGDDAFADDSDYDYGKSSRYYYDRHKGKARVIRYEYKTLVTKWYATDERTGQRVEVGEEQIEQINQAISLGAPVTLEEAKEDVVKVCEFCGSDILAEYEMAGPFDGFSIVPYTYMIDEETGTAYGFVRNLFDPQMELNKSKSLEIEHIAQASAPGVTAEVDTMVDEAQFKAALRQPGGVAMAKRDALVEGRIQERAATPPSMSVLQRAQSASELLTEISGIPSAAVFSPAEQAQAGITVAIRYHKSRQGVADPFANFEEFQLQVVEKVVQTITRAMPDDQIQAVLASEGRYQVGNGVVVEMAQAPDGSGMMVPKARAELRNLRDMDWNLDLEHTSENSTLRMIELDMLMQLMKANVPIDPEVLVEHVTPSRAVRERLKSYVEKAMRAQAEGSQREAQMFDAQSQRMAMVDMAKAQESARHNRVQEFLQAQKQDADTKTKFVEIWERADEAEKRFILDAIRSSAQNQQAMGA